MALMAKLIIFGFLIMLLIFFVGRETRKKIIYYILSTIKSIRLKSLNIIHFSKVNIKANNLRIQKRPHIKSHWTDRAN
jgi:hypothetical protein